MNDNLLNADEETAMAAAHIAKAYIGIFHASLYHSLPGFRELIEKKEEGGTKTSVAIAMCPLLLPAQS